MFAFALRATDVDLVADRLAETLGLPFVKHSSLYLGDYCLHQGKDGREVKVRWNRDPFYNPEIDPPEDRYREGRYAEHGVLVYASLPSEEEPAFAEAVRATFPDAVLMSAERTS